MGLISLRVLVNPEWMLILCVIWDSSVLVSQLLALQEGNAVSWMNKESSINFRQRNFAVIFIASTWPLRPAQPLIQSVVRVKWLESEANPLSLSSDRVKNMWRSKCCTFTPLYSHCLVLNETWKDLYLIWSVFILMSCVAHSTNFCVNNRRWIAI
jgi:hypothetical protein